jgi:hypothetical protein
MLRTGQKKNPNFHDGSDDGRGGKILADYFGVFFEDLPFVCNDTKIF